MGIRLISFFGGRQAAAPIFAGFASLRKLCVRTTTMLLVVLTSYLHEEIEVYYLNDERKQSTKFRSLFTNLLQLFDDKRLYKSEYLLYDIE